MEEARDKGSTGKTGAKAQKRGQDTEIDAAGIARFFFEAGQLKRVKRSGWWLAGVSSPESVAEHSFRTALIGWVLARMEGADAGKVAEACIFQDMSEARLNDMHKLGQRYVDFKQAEKKALEEQSRLLPGELAAAVRELFSSFQNDSSSEAIISRDADLLECAFQAKEYMETGHDTADWIANVEKLLRTGSARAILAEMKNMKSTGWWSGLKRIER